ncbi:uncharacterized protein F5891DRAFT_1280579 [Suillus fuscotomentosus]|uniref:Uncharacterized protein n=1 Tax=Suillus fuscotomentosus TaxID=1912939 RepID=A0AAD4HGA3_9AGAM|nr:uncharacterized protein F5891DRAFT_1280579 [Suillus fuscotomentosus]KAG1896550.1 hypothetical protein F5891DRAFT_1280579 [Suillus fuscotomentosus]
MQSASLPFEVHSSKLLSAGKLILFSFAVPSPDVIFASQMTGKTAGGDATFRRVVFQNFTLEASDIPIHFPSTIPEIGIVALLPDLYGSMSSEDSIR